MCNSSLALVQISIKKMKKKNGKGRRKLNQFARTNTELTFLQRQFLKILGLINGRDKQNRSVYYTYTYTYAYIYIYKYIYVYMHICTCTYINICVYLYIYIRIYIHIRICCPIYVYLLVSSPGRDECREAARERGRVCV